jgi:hypothetical protein
MTLRTLLASSALGFFVATAACGDAAEPLPTALDPERNVVEASPSTFAPTDGGVGMGTYEDDLPYVTVVLAQGALEDAGESNCGQFSPGDDDLELTLYGTLQAGTWTVSRDGIEAGVAELRWGEVPWTSGTVTIDEGSEERGSEVSGNIEATNEAGERFAMRFATLFHGCGRE